MTYLLVTILVTFSGAFSGLTLGLFSLNLTSIERKSKLGDPRATRILPVRRDGNLLLCTLLLGNVAVNSAVAILLESIAGGVVAGFISTGLIVIFGEILPQAAFARHALDISARMAWLVRVFQIILFPVAWPLARILDMLLGTELPTIWSKKEIKEIIRLHEDSPASTIDADEERIVLGALSFSERCADEVLTPWDKTFKLPSTTRISDSLLHKIRKTGFTRIPVFNKSKNKVTGVLFTKDLVGRKLNARKITSIMRKPVLKVRQDIHLDTLLRYFRTQRAHMAIVRDRKKNILGIVTLEDVIADIFRMQFPDEVDRLVQKT